jgi:hypothetical protein
MRNFISIFFFSFENNYFTPESHSLLALLLSDFIIRGDEGKNNGNHRTSLILAG